MSTYEIVTVGVSVGVSLASIALSLIKTIKAKKTAKVLSLWDKVPVYITQAEQIFGAKTGLAKLEFVLSKVQTDCVKLNLDVSDEEIKSHIEEILATPTTKKEVEKPEVVYHDEPIKNNSGYGQI